jgi:tRNA-dihydrouridine synthase B
LQHEPRLITLLSIWASQTSDEKVSIQIGPVQLEEPVILAPMSGVTDLPFRRLVKRSGAGLVVSEMIASEAMIRQNRQSLRMAENVPEEAPMAVPTGRLRARR